MAAAYGSSFGGCGTIVGTGTNLTFKGIYEQSFPKAPGIDFPAFMFYSTPVMVFYTFFGWVWLQFLYMGMFRPNSKAAKDADLGEEGARIATNVIRQKYMDLGPISTHEISVAVLFLLAIFGWFFRSPGFITGWAELITTLKIKDATPALLVVILLFMLPAKWTFLDWFNKDPRKHCHGMFDRMVSFYFFF